MDPVRVIVRGALCLIAAPLVVVLLVGRPLAVLVLGVLGTGLLLSIIEQLLCDWLVGRPRGP